MSSLWGQKLVENGKWYVEKKEHRKLTESRWDGLSQKCQPYSYNTRTYILEHDTITNEQLKRMTTATATTTTTEATKNVSHRNDSRHHCTEFPTLTHCVSFGLRVYICHLSHFCMKHNWQQLLVYIYRALHSYIQISAQVKRADTIHKLLFNWIK